jgi:hypothetical protein
MTSNSGHSPVSSPEHFSKKDSSAPPSVVEEEQAAPSQTELHQENSTIPADQSEQTLIPSASSETPPVSPVKSATSTNIHHKTPIPEKPQIRRTPSKVPGDYDPVTGYYRRKSDADTRASDVD